MPKPLVVSAIAAALMVLAVVLNPSAEQHRAKMTQTIAERSPIAGALGLGALAAFTSTYHPLGVASYTTVNDRTMSVGAFGWVWVLQPSSAE